MGKLAIVPDLAAVEALGSFDGREVGGTSIKVTNAGDGLSEALKVDPTEFHLGDIVYVVLQTEVVRVEHKSIEDGDETGPLERAHVLRAGAATIVDSDVVAEQLKVQAARIRKAREAAQGVQPIPRADGQPAGWDGEHAEDDAAPGLYDDPTDES